MASGGAAFAATAVAATEATASPAMMSFLGMRTPPFANGSWDAGSTGDGAPRIQLRSAPTGTACAVPVATVCDRWMSVSAAVVPAASIVVAAATGAAAVVVAAVGVLELEPLQGDGGCAGLLGATC